MKTEHKQFTLTAEEVELLNDVLIHLLKDKVLTFFNESKELIDNLLKRMKQYQDESEGEKGV